MMKIFLLSVVIVLAIAGYVFAAEPQNPGPSQTRAEIMAQIYRVPAGETFQQSGGDAGTSGATAAAE